MAVTLDKIDMIEGASLVREGEWTKELIRVARVTGLPDGVASKGLNAALTSGVLPTVWSTHPDSNLQNLRLVSYRLEADGPFSCMVYMRYVNYAIRYWSGMGAVVTIQTDEDRNGVPQKVYNNNDGIPEDEVIQPGVFTTTAAEGVIQCRCIQGSLLTTGGINPLLRMRDYVNHINANPWFYGDAGDWMLENFEWDAGDLGDIAWNCCYTFRYKADGWRPRAVWIDRDTGEPGVDLEEGFGRITVDKLVPADFDQLGLGTLPGMGGGR